MGKPKRNADNQIRNIRQTVDHTSARSISKRIKLASKFNITLCGTRDTTIEASLTDSLCRITLPFTPTRILPNTDGRGYGLFVPDNNSLHWLLEHWQEIDNETTRQAVLMMMHENYQAKGIPNTAWMNALLNGIHCEKNPLIASTLTNYLSSPLQEICRY